MHTASEVSSNEGYAGASSSTVSMPSGSTRGGGQSAAVSAVRPAWSTEEIPGWGAAKDRTGLGDHPSLLKLWHLPSPHLLLNLSANAHGILILVHNWMRIRSWSLQLVLQPAAHGMVLMSTREWRMALEGKYVQVRHVAMTEEATGAADQRQEHLSVLPANPKVPSKRPSAEPEEGEMLNFKKRRTEQTAAQRGAVNVRFGVHGGFAPYDTAMKIRWGDRSYSLEELSTAQEVWAALLYDLTIVNFRLEVLQLDRHYCPHLYAGADGGFQRSQSIIAVWTKDWTIVPDYTRADVFDLFSADDPTVRRAALENFAKVLSEWPTIKIGASTLDAHQDVLEFYIRSAHAVLHRVPTTPILPPRTMYPV